ncbi:MAG: polymer-forming cytoskeletal protein [Lachnospiraceae bacterium]|nr:polymer-forming cytoskeletal protein [Lachnospiraceae bacterium]
MGFFSDLKQDLAQAVNELTEDNAEKELLEEEERLRAELLQMEDEFQVSGVEEPEVTTEEEYAHFMAEEAVYEEVPEEITEAQDEEIAQEDFTGVNEAVMASLSEGYASIADTLPDAQEDALADELEAAVAELDEEADAVSATDETVVEEGAEGVDSFGEVEEIEEIKEVEEVEEIEEIEKVEEVKEMMQDVFTAVPEMKDEYVSMADENAEVGIIPAGMMITGDIATSGALDLRGTVLGNIEIGGKLNVSGSIQGNAKAVEIFAQAAKITGDIECDNSVKIGPNTVVIGNVSARCAVVAGAIKGDIDVRGPVILDSSAVVKGNIKSKSVQINNGAIVEGMCSQCYADVNASSFFDGLE